jgi:hypothetical protein
MNLLSPAERLQHEEALAEFKAGLGEGRFTELYREGQAFTFEQVMALALEEDE